MKVGLYSIKDSRSGQYGVPYTAVNDDVAKRQFLMFVADNSFASEFKLMRVGEFRDVDESGDSAGVSGMTCPTVVEVADSEIESYRSVLRKMRTVKEVR